jgi:uncharacterized protein YwqG
MYTGYRTEINKDGLSMYLKSKIIPVKNSDEYIVVYGLSNQFNSSPIDLFDTRHVSITKRKLNSKETIDLTSLCTLPFKSNNQLVEHLETQAKAQYKQSQIKNLSLAEVNRYQENYKNNLVAAELAKLDRLHLPVSIEMCGENHLLIGFVVCKSNFANLYNQEFIGTLRLVDINNQKIIKEKTVKSKGIATKARHHAELIACDYYGRSGLFNSLSNNKAGMYGGQLRVVEKALFTKVSLPREQKELLPAFRTEVKATKDHWVVFKHSTDGCQLLVLEYVSGKVVKSFNLAKNSENFDLSADNNIAVIIHSNGMLSVIDIEKEKVDKFKVHLGVEKNSYLSVKVAGNGRWVASAINDKQLCIVNVKTKKTHQLEYLKEQTLEQERIHDVEINTQIGPMYEFVNNELVIIDANGTQIINPENVIFENSEIEKNELDLSAIDCKSTLQEMLVASNLSSKFSILEKFYSPSIKLSTRIKKRTFKKELGKSQVGGWPDLPIGTNWPQWNDRPMSFLAQINLEEIHEINPQLHLPKQGLLSFFLGCTDESYNRSGKNYYMVDLLIGCEALHQEGIKIIYTKDLDKLMEVKNTESILPELFNSCEIIPTLGGNPLPDVHSTVYEQLLLKGVEVDNYNKLLDKVNVDRDTDENWDNLFMGYPQLIQMNPPEIFCERAKLGLDPYQKASEKELNASSQWAMILQLTSDPKPDFIWGDGGHFYFYSNREKVLKGDFSESWVYFEN